MKFLRKSSSGGFTLMETVIAIGVLALLLTAFLAVFGPATTGLRKAISVQEADRLAAALERELVTLRPGSSGTDYTTGFDKAYKWIEAANEGDKSILLYQYRGNPNEIREDGSMEPYTQGGGVAGRDYIVQPMVRQRNDSLVQKDLKALDGRIFTVKLTQLVFENGTLTKNSDGGINQNPQGETGSSEGAGGAGSDGFREAVLAFSAEFFIVPNSAPEYVQIGGKFDPAKLTKPIFTRNLAVRR